MIRFLSLILNLIFIINANAMWQCPAVDQYGQIYTVNSGFVKTAIYKSLDRCKNLSNVPATCQVERALCNHIGIRDTSKTYWQCFAFDNTAGKYSSGPYSDRYEAAHGAESLCKRLSETPSSCYVRLFICEKI